MASSLPQKALTKLQTKPWPSCKKNQNRPRFWRQMTPAKSRLVSAPRHHDRQPELINFSLRRHDRIQERSCRSDTIRFRTLQSQCCLLQAGRNFTGGRN
jgi:hypothetical protein